MGRFRALLGGLVGAGGAIIASLCCVLPVTIVLLGLGSGAFMATTIKYTSIFVPVGVISVSAGFYLHFLERRRCTRGGCPMAGKTITFVLLTLSAMVVAAALFFTLLPALSSDLMMWATAKQGQGATPTMSMPTGSPSLKGQ